MDKIHLSMTYFWVVECLFIFPFIFNKIKLLLETLFLFKCNTKQLLIPDTENCVPLMSISMWVLKTIWVHMCSHWKHTSMFLCINSPEWPLLYVKMCPTLHLSACKVKFRQVNMNELLSAKISIFLNFFSLSVFLQSMMKTDTIKPWEYKLSILQK